MGANKDLVNVITFGVRDTKAKSLADRSHFYYQLTEMSVADGGLTKLLIGVFPV